MPVTTSYDLALAVSNLTNSVANSANFQSWTGAANTTAALAFIYAGEAPAAATLPFAVIWVKSWGGIRISEGANEEFENDGRLVLQLVAQVEKPDSPDNRSDDYLQMLNRVGGVREDVLKLAGQSGYLAIADMNVRSVKRFTPQDEAARGQSLWIALIDILVRP